MDILAKTVVFRGNKLTVRGPVAYCQTHLECKLATTRLTGSLPLDLWELAPAPRRMSAVACAELATVHKRVPLTAVGCRERESINVRPNPCTHLFCCEHNRSDCLDGQNHGSNPVRNGLWCLEQASLPENESPPIENCCSAVVLLLLVRQSCYVR
jgi:hypothetical protein